MNKYDPNESITCPKCGMEFTPLGAEYDKGSIYDGPTIKFTCVCSYEFKRRPLDYEGDEDE